MRRLILFLHGLGGSDEKSWGAFKTLIDADPDLDGFETAFISQPSSFWRGWFSPVAATIETLAGGLHTELIERCADYDQVLLVTHSMGGLVARKWLVNLTMRVSPTNVGGIVFFAVPHEGSSLARYGVRLSADHKQLAQLAPGSPFIRQLNEAWVAMDCDRLFAMTNVTAMQDGCVPPESSAPLWMKVEKRTVNGSDHRSVIKPAKTDDMSYRVVRNAALALAGGAVGTLGTRAAAVAEPTDPSTPETGLGTSPPARMGNPLFYRYTPDDEPYYLVRPGDGRLAQIVPYRNLWLHGSAGCGKTVCITRVLVRLGGRQRQISLGSAAGGGLDRVLSVMETQLSRGIEASDPGSADVIDRIVHLLNVEAGNGLAALLVEEIPLGDAAENAFFAAVRAMVLRHAAQAPGVPVRLVFTSLKDPGKAFEGNDLASESLAVFGIDDWSEAELEALLRQIAPELGIELDEDVVRRVLRSPHTSPRFIKVFLGNLRMLDSSSPDAVDDALAATTGSLAP